MEEVRMIGIMIFEANVLHWVEQLDMKSPDSDYCRYRADDLHFWQKLLNALRGLRWKPLGPESKMDLYESAMMLRRLEVYFSKRNKMIEEIQANAIYDKDYEAQLKSGV